MRSSFIDTLVSTKEKWCDGGTISIAVSMKDDCGLDCGWEIERNEPQVCHLYINKRVPSQASSTKRNRADKFSGIKISL